MSCLGFSVPGPTYTNKQLVKAACEGNVATLQAALAAHPARVGLKTWNRRTLLYFAARDNQPAVLQLLVDHLLSDRVTADVRAKLRGYGCNAKQILARLVNGYDLLGLTPLLAACARGHSECVGPLLQAGADVWQGEWLGGKGPLHFAAQAGCVNSIMAILSVASERVPPPWFTPVRLVDSRTAGGLTPLHYAAYWGHAQVCKALLSHGASLQVKNKHWGDMDIGVGFTPLHVAACRGHEDVVKVLLMAYMESMQVAGMANNPGRAARPEMYLTDPRRQRTTDRRMLPYQLANECRHTVILNMLHPDVPFTYIFSNGDLESSTLFGAPRLGVIAAAALQRKLLDDILACIQTDKEAALDGGCSPPKRSSSSNLPALPPAVTAPVVTAPASSAPRNSRPSSAGPMVQRSGKSATAAGSPALAPIGSAASAPSLPGQLMGGPSDHPGSPRAAAAGLRQELRALAVDRTWMPPIPDSAYGSLSFMPPEVESILAAARASQHSRGGSFGASMRSGDDVPSPSGASSLAGGGGGSARQASSLEAQAARRDAEQAMASMSSFLEEALSRLASESAADNGPAGPQQVKLTPQVLKAAARGGSPPNPCLVDSQPASSIASEPQSPRSSPPSSIATSPAGSPRGPLSPQASVLDAAAAAQTQPDAGASAAEAQSASTGALPSGREATATAALGRPGSASSMPTTPPLRPAAAAQEGAAVVPHSQQPGSELVHADAAQAPAVPALPLKHALPANEQGLLASQSTPEVSPRKERRLSASSQPGKQDEGEEAGRRQRRSSTGNLAASAEQQQPASAAVPAATMSPPLADTPIRRTVSTHLSPRRAPAAGAVRGGGFFSRTQVVPISTSTGGMASGTGSQGPTSPTGSTLSRFGMLRRPVWGSRNGSRRNSNNGASPEGTSHGGNGIAAFMSSLLPLGGRAGRSSGASSSGDERECGVCLCDPAIIAVVPCAHALCVDCSRELCKLHHYKPSQCPFCRITIQGFKPRTFPAK